MQDSGFYVLPTGYFTGCRMAKLFFQMGHVYLPLHLMGMYAFEVPRMYRDREERGKQTMCIDLVSSDQGQLWQSGVQI